MPLSGWTFVKRTGCSHFCKKTGSLALALQVSTGQLVKKTRASAGHCLTEPEQSPVKDVKVKLPLYISGPGNTGSV